MRLRWLLVLVPVWGLVLAAGGYATRLRCVEEAGLVELAPGVTVAEHCGDVVRDQLPGLVIAVSAVAVAVALLWTATVLVVRRRRAAPAPARR
ncbi:hypothetical protein [Cellulomonas xylanilytica]|uniref:Uncharacterized protein n=1 Tax=Cellulomonas xylanilytica TaxID=233583 RepID=A0A510V9M5_9CELL|nr:hypothetical protein [Cellulomonas xylanilytica]GEK21865.1 hypothetical protein CXY01_23850 [Cellulomonas xylanilytica]